MANSKLTELDSISSLTTDDALYVVDSPGGSPTSKRATLDVVQSSMTKVGKVNITQPATSATLTIADGSTLTVANNSSIANSNSGDQFIVLSGDVGGSGTDAITATIANDAVTYAKMQNVSATDKVLGRSTAGSGDVEEIPCTSTARSLLDDASTSAMRTTLGVAIGTDVQAYDADLPLGTITYVIDGGGAVPTAGVKGFLQVPYNCTIQSVTLLADQSGSVVVDIWKDIYANYPPTDADSITASAVPTISSATNSTDSTLTGWTTAITAGDVLGYNIDSISSITRLTIALKVTK